MVRFLLTSCLIIFFSVSALAENSVVHIQKFADLECPYGKKVQPMIKKLMNEYGSKISFEFKTMPLDYHPTSRIAARYYYSLKKQNPQLAMKFYHQVYENQATLKSNKGNEKFLEKTVRNIGANLDQLNKDVKSKEIDDLINRDIAEAVKLKINETPGLVINGKVLPGGIEPTWEQIHQAVKDALVESNKKFVSQKF